MKCAQLILLILICCSTLTSCIPASQCQEVSNTIQEAILFLCEISAKDAGESTQAIENQLIERLKKFPNNPKAVELVNRLRALASLQKQ